MKVIAHFYNAAGRRYHKEAFTSPATARKWAKQEGAAALVLEQGDIEVAYYLGSTKSERWVAVNLDRFQQWRREAS